MSGCWVAEAAAAGSLFRCAAVNCGKRQLSRSQGTCSVTCQHLEEKEVLKKCLGCWERGVGMPQLFRENPTHFFGSQVLWSMAVIIACSLTGWVAKKIGGG